MADFGSQHQGGDLFLVEVFEVGAVLDQKL
jgi:hypothetical protein